MKFIHNNTNKTNTIKRKYSRGEKMINRNMTVLEAIQENHQVEQILLSFGIGCGIFSNNIGSTIEDICIKRGIDVEKLLNELNYNRFY